MKSNPSTLLLPLAALSLASCANQKKEETKRPNIIFMMTDDHTTQAMSCYGGNLIQTPNMDRIANEGIRFDNCYAVNALSGPSRACILTGKFSHENGFTDNASTFNGDQQTFPKLLQQAGYQTAMIGKWHLISEPQGFDHWSILSGQHEQGEHERERARNAIGRDHDVFAVEPIGNNAAERGEQGGGKKRCHACRSKQERRVFGGGDVPERGEGGGASRKDGGGLPRPDKRDGALPIVGQQVTVRVDLGACARGFGSWSSRRLGRRIRGLLVGSR